MKENMRAQYNHPYDLLRTSPPMNVQHASNAVELRTTIGNKNATSPLKAAAMKVLQCNKGCNKYAQEKENSCNNTKHIGHQLLQSWEGRIKDAIIGLPVTFQDTVDSPLFTKEDLKDIENGMFSREKLRLYIGSWLMNGKLHPTPLYKDYEKRLSESGLSE